MIYDDLQIVEEVSGKLELKSRSLFKNPTNPLFLKFVKQVFGTLGVKNIRLNLEERTASISYDSKQTGWKSIITGIFNKSTNSKRIFIAQSLISYPELSKKVICFAQYRNLITNWEVLHELPGRIRMKHPTLFYRKECCGDLEKVLLDTPGVEKAKVSSLTASVLIVYNDRVINKNQLIKISDTALKSIPEAAKKIERPSIQGLPLSSLTMGLALVPGLGPYTVPLILYTGWPIFKRAGQALKRKKIKVDILDTAVIASCLAFRQYGAAAFMVWILDVADIILDRTSQQSKGLLDKAFGQQARFAWVLKGKREIQVPIEKINRGDTVVISTGEQIPVDGKVKRGEGILDQHMLTGESAPVEKKLNDEVFASTVVLAGKLYVEVEKTGRETTTAKIVQIIKKSAEYKPRVMSFGERMADRAVIPTLGLGGIGMTTGGSQSLMAILNADFGTGIRVAAPTAVLAHIAKAARSGIIIKKGVVLETLPEINTFLFDKTGTLTRETPEIPNIIPACKGVSEEQILAYAASAERRFSHPIAKAILEKADQLKIKIPKRDKSEYHVGLGIYSVINGDKVKVGSLRFMEKERIKVPSLLEKRLKEIHNQGKSAILVSINDLLAGAIEFQSSHRAEAYDTIEKLKQRGIKNLVLISGDHEAATQDVAQKLGIDYYFSEVLPQDKANYVRELQKRGGKVAMVGDGINDGAALSLADVSISLKGASDIAVDAADIVFMDGNLTKLDQLYDISMSLKKSLNRSFKLIVVPNAICIVGALLGVVNLRMSLVLNNIFNIGATAQATVPLYRATEPISAQP